MKVKLIVLILFLATNIYGSAYCKEGDSGIFGMYKPPFIPVEITINEDGIEMSASGEIITIYGTFGLGYSKNFASNNNDCFYVVINNTSTDKKTVYSINKGEELTYDDLDGQGLKHFKLNPNRLEFDITNKDRFRISISESSIYAEKLSLKIEDSSLKMKKGEKEFIVYETELPAKTMLKTVNPFYIQEKSKELMEFILSPSDDK